MCNKDVFGFVKCKYFTELKRNFILTNMLALLIWLKLIHVVHFMDTAK